MIIENFNNYSNEDVLYKMIETLQKIAFLDLKHFAKWNNEKIEINYNNPDLFNLIDVKISKNGTIKIKAKYNKNKALNMLYDLIPFYNVISKYEHKIIKLPANKNVNIEKIIKEKYKIA